MSNEFIVEYRSFDKVECCLDIVAVFGNNVERVFREILSFRQRRNKLNVLSLFRLGWKVEISFDIVVKSGNNVEATFDFVERIVWLVAFDHVASTMLLV